MPAVSRREVPACQAGAPNPTQPLEDVVSNIEAVPQPRIDVLVTAADGSGRPVRRTEYRGTVWFGGRPRLAAWGSVAKGPSSSGISNPFWLPDSLAYKADGAAGAVVAATASLQSVQATGQVIEVNASLQPHPGRAGLAFVLFRIQAVAAVPLGISYQVVVLADPDLVVG